MISSEIFHIGSESPWSTGGVSLDLGSGQGIHAFLGHLTSGVYLVPGLDLLALLGVDQDRTVHILHSFFSIPAVLYYMDRRLLNFPRVLPSEGLPSVTDILFDASAVRRAIYAVLGADHQVH